MLNRLLKNKFVRSGAVYSVASFIVSVIGYLLNMIIARSFSLTDYGEYITALSYTIFLGIPLSAFSMVVIKRIGRAKEEDRISVAISIEQWLKKEIIQYSPYVLSIFLLLGAGIFFKGNMSFIAVLFILSSALVGIYQNFYASVLQSYKNFLVAGLFMITIFSVKMFLTIGVIVLNPTISLLFLAFITSGVFSIVYGRKVIRQTKKKKLVVKEVSFQRLTRYINQPSILIPLFTTLGIVGLANADVVLVKKFFNGEISGLYGSLSLLGKIILYVAAPLSSVAFTFFTGSDSKHQSIKILALLTLVIGGLGTAATIFYALFPTLVVNIIFGSKFLGVSHLVWMAAVFGSLYSLMNLFAQYFVAKSSKFAYLGILAVVFQTLGIYIFHSSLDQVLMINIGVTGALVLIYVLEVIRREYLYARK